MATTNCQSLRFMDPPKKLDSNPPILFVHGMNDTHHKWMPILERVLAEGAT